MEALVEVDGVLPGDHLLLPRRSALLVRHPARPPLLLLPPCETIASVPAAREEIPTSDGGLALYGTVRKITRAAHELGRNLGHRPAKFTGRSEGCML